MTDIHEPTTAEKPEKSPEERGIRGDALVAEYQLYRKIGAYFILGGLLVLIVGLTISALFQPRTATVTPKFGIHFLLDDGRNRWDVDLWDAHFAYAEPITDAGGIAVQVIRSDDLEAARWQVFMDLCAEYELTPVLRLATTFDFDSMAWTAPERGEDGTFQHIGDAYAAFLNALDWPTEERHVILLNEPNNGHEWGGDPSPEDYADFVEDVAGVLRDEVANVVILNAAFDLNLPNTNDQPFPGTNTVMIDANTFIDQMEAHRPGIFARFDIWNSHPYPLDLRAHPAEQVYRFDAINGAVIDAPQPPEGIHNRGINGYEWALWKLNQLGYTTDLPVMITETGWRHNAPVDPASSDAGADYPSPEQVAAFWELALLGADDASFVPWLTDERVIGIAPFALNGVPDEWSHTNLVRMAPDGTVSGTYAHYDLLATIANAD